MCGRKTKALDFCLRNLAIASLKLDLKWNRVTKPVKATTHRTNFQKKARSMDFNQERCGKKMATSRICMYVLFTFIKLQVK